MIAVFQSLTHCSQILGSLQLNPINFGLEHGQSSEMQKMDVFGIRKYLWVWLTNLWQCDIVFFFGWFWLLKPLSDCRQNTSGSIWIAKAYKHVYLGAGAYFSLISGSVCSLWLLFHPYMIFGKPSSHHLRYDHCPIHMSCRDNMSCSFTTRRWTLFYHR